VQIPQTKVAKSKEYMAHKSDIEIYKDLEREKREMQVGVSNKKRSMNLKEK